MASELIERVAGVAGPIAAALGCEVVAVQAGGGRRRTMLRILLDDARPAPTEAEREAAAVPFDPDRDGVPVPYEGSRVTVDTCADASRQIAAVVDAEGLMRGAWTLEVSSPGLDRPLVRPDDWIRHRGRVVDVRTRVASDGSRRIRGRVAAVRGGEVVLAAERPDGEAIRFRFADVESARLVVDLPRPGKPGRPARKAG
jgi:ribosome maturation factor RimP